MKKSLTVISVVIALAFALGLMFAPSAAAYADDAYTVNCIKAPARNLKDNTTAGQSRVMLLDSSGNPAFYIPETYYVKVLDDNAFGGSYYKVEYAALSDIFYIDKSSLTATENSDAIVPSAVQFGVSVSMFPDLRLHLKETESIQFSDGINVVTITSADDYNIKFLGSNDENVYVTASRNGSSYKGLVPKEKFAAFSVPYHPISEAERQALLSSPDGNVGGNGEITPNSSKTLRIILIVGIVVPAVLIVLLLFKPAKDGGNNYDKRAMKKTRRNNEYDYDRSRSYSKDYDRRERDYDRRDYPRDYDRDYDRDRDYPRRERDFDERERYYRDDRDRRY